MENAMVKKSHSLSIKGETTITGVTQVIAIEDKEVKVAVGERTLVLSGEGFNAEKLSLEEGVLVLSGEVAAARYVTTQSGKSLLKKLFFRLHLRCKCAFLCFFNFRSSISYFTFTSLNHACDHDVGSN